MRSWKKEKWTTQPCQRPIFIQSSWYCGIGKYGGSGRESSIMNCLWKTKQIIPSTATNESKSEVSQSCLTLCDPMDCGPPGSSVHGDSPGKNTGMGCHAFLLFPIQGSNLGLPHCRWILYHLRKPWWRTRWKRQMKLFALHRKEKRPESVGNLAKVMQLENGSESEPRSVPFHWVMTLHGKLNLYKLITNSIPSSSSLF